MEFQIYSAADAALVEGCKKGDRRAQECLYEKYSAKLYALCCRYVRDRMEAEDVMVTSFMKVFERISQYKGAGSFEGWIRRIAVNESLTYLRKNKYMYLESDMEQVDRKLNFNQLENHFEAEDLTKLIAELPTGYRIIFNLYVIDGYSHKEIAEQLGISENTSKSQLSRARALLRRHLLVLEKDTVKKTVT